MMIPDEQSVRAPQAPTGSLPTPKSSRQLSLVRELLRARDRHLQPPDEVPSTGPRTASQEGRLSRMTRSHKTTPAPPAHRRETQVMDAAVAQQRVSDCVFFTQHLAEIGQTGL